MVPKTKPGSYVADFVKLGMHPTEEECTIWDDQSPQKSLKILEQDQAATAYSGTFQFLQKIEEEPPSYQNTSRNNTAFKHPPSESFGSDPVGPREQGMPSPSHNIQKISFGSGFNNLVRPN